MWLLFVPWGSLIQGAGIAAAIFLGVRIVYDLVKEHRARRLNS